MHSAVKCPHCNKIFFDVNSDECPFCHKLLRITENDFGAFKDIFSDYFGRKE